MDQTHFAFATRRPVHPVLLDFNSKYNHMLQAFAPTASASEHTWFKMRQNNQNFGWLIGLTPLAYLLQVIDSKGFSPAWLSNRVRAHNFKLFSNLQT